MKKVTLATLFALGLSAGALAQQSAPQQPPQEGSAPSFETADKNKDGMISREEASAVRGLDFATADANKDAELDRREYTAAVARLSQPRG